MAYDARREDYQRLGLRFAASLDEGDAFAAARSFATFGRRFAQDRDSLPQTDSDRAFYLVAVATHLIDYELPFADEPRAQEIISDGHRVLDEALTLDAHCYDALRMRAAADSSSFEGFLQFLNETADDVRAWCEEQRQAVTRGDADERDALWTNICMRPYVRWLNTQAEQALICGRNKEALRFAHASLEVDPHDGGDVRFTAALAHAKLEDADGLERLLADRRNAGQLRPSDDAWTLLARLALAYKACDFDGARRSVDELLRRYPHAADALIRQQELPDGVFSRLAALPYSEDELILAISEGTVLLQEGVDMQGRGVLSSWLTNVVGTLRPDALLAAMVGDAQAAARGNAEGPSFPTTGGQGSAV